MVDPAKTLALFLAGWLGACAPVVTGPYYQPSYPEKSEQVDIRPSSAFSLSSDQWSIRPYPGYCDMSLKAFAANDGLTLLWSVNELGNPPICHINIHDEPIVIENMDNGRRDERRILERAFYVGPALDVRQEVNLAKQIPGFAGVPETARKYALSFETERIFDGKLPDLVTIRLPDIALGKRRLHLPAIHLQRYERSGKGWWYALRSERKPKPTRFAGKSLGGGYLAYKPADVLYEEGSLLKVSLVFRGEPFVWNRSFTKRNNGKSRIDGEIFVEVMNGKPIRLVGDRVAWRIPLDEKSALIPIKYSKWQIKRFTTVNLNEHLDALLEYGSSNEKYDSWDRFFRIAFPGYQPKHFKVKLPRMDLNGQPWRILPIEFRYKAHGMSTRPL